MKKLKLTLDELAVESFPTDGAISLRGTVNGHLDTAGDCDTQNLSCTCENPCTSDGYATINAELCGSGYNTVCNCGSSQTVNALSCAGTGICCGGHSEFSRCC